MLGRILRSFVQNPDHFENQEKQLDILVGIAMTQSIPESVSLAQATDNPYILDELHDVLVDKFYSELVKRGKI